MGTEWASYGIAIAILALIVDGLLFRMSKTERRENVEILERLKTEFFPQLEANLSDILQKLEKEEAGEYASLVMRNLGATLKLEFNLRFEDKAWRLEQLKEDLGVHEKELNQLAANTKGNTSVMGVKSNNLRLKKTVNDLLQNVQELSKLEKLPGRLPVVGH